MSSTTDKKSKWNLKNVLRFLYIVGLLLVLYWVGHTSLVPVVAVEPEGIVYADQSAWRTYFVIEAPTLVRVHQADTICSRSNTSECSWADGIYPSGLPREHKDKKTVLQDPQEGGRSDNGPGNYRALIARLCHGAECSSPMQTGVTFAVCSADYEAQLWTNGFTIRGPIKSNNQDFGGNSNRNQGYGFEKFPGDAQAVAACNAHPHQAVVPIS